jgi:hypothetical protein
VDAETFLEVLGADFGVQDLLCHVAGEPASLLVMQAFTKDPPCGGRQRAQGFCRPGDWGGGFLPLASELLYMAGEIRDSQEPGSCSAHPFPLLDWF